MILQQPKRLRTKCLKSILWNINFIIKGRTVIIDQLTVKLEYWGLLKMTQLLNKLYVQIKDLRDDFRASKWEFNLLDRPNN